VRDVDLQKPGSNKDSEDNPNPWTHNLSSSVCV
jgi:hypothetical protein